MILRFDPGCKQIRRRAMASLSGLWPRAIIIFALCTVLVKCEGEVAAPAAPAAASPAAPTGSGDFNPRLAISAMIIYMQTHPYFVSGAFAWIMVGSVFWIAGFVLFIFSEISAVLICRDQDFRLKLIYKNQATAAPTAAYEKLVSRERQKLEPRPYLTLTAILLMLGGTSCFLCSLCDVIQILGLPSSPCVVLVTFGAFAITICNVTFLMFVLWSCTRPWAAIVFLVISLSGSVLLPYGNPILFVVWALLALGGGFAYFFYLPTTYNSSDMPPWIQNVGILSVDLTPEKVQGAFVGAYKVTVEETKERVQAAKQAAEDAVAKAKQDAEAAAKNAANAIPGSNSEVKP